MRWIGSRAGTRWLVGLVLVLSAVAFPAGAVVHEATVPVADRSEAARQDAVRQALSEVLVRLSGDPALPQQAGVAPLLAEAGRYLQQYQYEGSETAGTLALRAGFDAAALEGQLRQQGLVLWGRERPPLLVWLAVDDGQRRYLLGAEDADPVLMELRAAARREALSLILPLFDLEDQSRVSFTSVWRGDLESVDLASERYRATAVVMGGLQRSADGWTARWALRHAGRDSAWQTGAADLAGTLGQGLSQAAAGVTVRAAAVPLPHSQTRVPLVVDGVAGLADYARLSGYLRGLAPVRSAELVAVQGRRMELLVDVQGGAQGLDQALARDGILEADRSVSGGPEGAAVYRLRP
jgi:uncharacterized protein